MSTRGDPSEPSIPRVRPSRDPNFRAAQSVGNIQKLKADLEACFGWTDQTTQVLAYHLEDLQTLAAWLYGNAAASHHTELGQASHALQYAARSLDELVAALETARTHGNNYIEIIAGGGPEGLR